tara:strand:+ start:460 stop:1158 length:699 start_codon:yes stop_codon:yes gene_type:complete
MIPKKIHQIFFNWGKPINEIELFKKSIETLKKENPEFEHKLWNEDECLEMVKNNFPEYLYFYLKLRHNIQRVDFARFCILYIEGGFYIDLDMHCIKNFTPLLNNKLILQTNRHLIPKHPEFIINDFMATQKEFIFWKIVMKECVINYKEKEKIDVYKTWKGRFVLQTTGPRFLSRVLKKAFPKYKPHHVIWTKWRNELYKVMPRTDYYVECFRAGSWLNNTNENLKNHKTFK